MCTSLAYVLYDNICCENNSCHHIIYLLSANATTVAYISYPIYIGYDIYGLMGKIIKNIWLEKMQELSHEEGTGQILDFFY